MQQEVCSSCAFTISGGKQDRRVTFRDYMLRPSAVGQRGFTRRLLAAQPSAPCPRVSLRSDTEHTPAALRLTRWAMDRTVSSLTTSLIVFERLHSRASHRQLCVPSQSCNVGVVYPPSTRSRPRSRLQPSRLWWAYGAHLRNDVTRCAAQKRLGLEVGPLRPSSASWVRRRRGCGSKWEWGSGR